ncbi:MAG: hypothetical protein E7433_06535 [Ruminococcaceae bacterium]|nr:hypothetical protein [Oscillospiraceae bacterium]
MKKVLLPLLAVMLVLIMCACETGADPTTNPGTTGSTTSTTTTGSTQSTTSTTTSTGATASTTATTPTNVTTPVTTPTGTTPVVTTPAATTPAVTTPAVTTPAVTTPAVTTPAVTTPAVTTPAATSCSHSWQDATCKAPKTCTKCGAKEGSVGAHTEVVIPGKAATCTDTGLTEGKKCSVCDVVTKTQQTIPTIAHTEVDVPATATSCKAPGLTAGKKCSVCGTFTVPQQTIPALEHTYGEWSLGQEATCNTYGYSVRTCSVCGHEDKEDIRPTGIHEYVNGKCACGYEIQGTKGLAYKLSSDGTYYICTGYDAYKLPSKIVIPPYYNGKPVKECVGNGVVDLFDTVKEIEVSEGVEVIGRMFFYCNGATTITIPSSVNRIHGIGISCKNLQVAYVNSTGWALGTKSVDLSNPTAAATQLKKYNDGKWYTR